LDDEAKRRALTRMAERIARESVKLPTVIQHFHSQKLSASFDGELLLMWLLSIVYYGRRKAQFH